EKGPSNRHRNPSASPLHFAFAPQKGFFGPPMPAGKSSVTQIIPRGGFQAGGAGHRRRDGTPHLPPCVKPPPRRPTPSPTIRQENRASILMRPCGKRIGAAPGFIPSPNPA